MSSKQSWTIKQRRNAHPQAGLMEAKQNTNKSLQALKFAKGAP